MVFLAYFPVVGSIKQPAYVYQAPRTSEPPSCLEPKFDHKALYKEEDKLFQKKEKTIEREREFSANSKKETKRE